MEKVKKTVFVAMSGGVDSSTAAFLLKKQGYNVVGGFIRGFNIDECQSRDMVDARRVAEQLKIPFHVFDFEEEYKKYVVDYMVDGYKKGITPNPDILCNREIKFGLFFKKAIEMGADYVATGHYVRLSRIVFRKQHIPAPAADIASLSPRHSSLRSETKLSGLRDVPQNNSAKPLCSLFVAKDKNKDQSYFLWTLTQEHLKKCLFPIGDYIKPEIRKIAKTAGLVVAAKKDSQGICFLGKVLSIKDFLMGYLPVKKGNVKTVDGKQIGVHDGVWFYTIGQRHGLGISANQSYYIADKDLKNNVLIVAEGDDHPALYKKEVELEDINFITNRGEKWDVRGGIRVLARVRYRQPLIKAKLQQISNLKSQIPTYKLDFKKPVKFVAPGQSAVFYKPRGIWPFRKTEMLGGGVIASCK